MILAVLSLTAGCGGSVTIEDAFPQPLVERLPLRVALDFPPSLLNYTHTETVEGGGEWTLRLGPASERMLDVAFNGMFLTTRRVESAASAAAEMPDLDATISVAIEGVEISLPQQSGTDQYAVWIRYTLDVYDRDGELLHRWPVSAYGQSRKEGLSGAKSMRRAVLLALRDAEAEIVVGFAEQPVLRERLLGGPDRDET
jgi:hypothetical protein